MKLLVDRLLDSPALHRFEGSEEWWAELRPAIPEVEAGPLEPVCVELRAHRMGDDVYLEGELSGALELGCGRCLARYRYPLQEPFRLVLEPAGARVPADPEAAEALFRRGLCLGDELETGWFRGSEIDLGAFFRELIALALPVQPLCREECRGLCPQCGVDRNVESCSCAQAQSTSPFAVLRALQGDRKEGDG